MASASVPLSACEKTAPILIVLHSIVDHLSHVATAIIT
jgi:hypothetical protein